MRTLTDGLQGTAMPPFGLLPENERDLLARYVTYLSIRGQVEFETLAARALRRDNRRAGLRTGRVKAVLAEWEKAESAPAAPAAARRRRAGLTSSPGGRAPGIRAVHPQGRQLVHHLPRRVRPQAGAAVRRVGNGGEARRPGRNRTGLQGRRPRRGPVRAHPRRDCPRRHAGPPGTDRPPGVGPRAVREVRAEPARAAAGRAEGRLPEAGGAP